MSFLPEDDREYFDSKGLTYLAKEEAAPKKRGIVVPEFCFAGSLHEAREGVLVPRNACELLVLIPDGYNTTKLDSFYTRPILKRLDGSNPNAATEIQSHFGESWQFWSRHLTQDEWKQSARGFEVYIPYIRAALRAA